MQYGDADRDLAIRTILGEEGTPDGQTGVAAVILNRLAAGSYGKSLGDVILAPNQFEPWSHPERTDELFKIPRDDPRYVRAARILDGVSSGTIPDPTGGATHFYAPGAQAALGRLPPNWASGGGQKLGQTMFYAPQGRVTRQPVKSPSDDPAMRAGLQQMGDERQLAAAREAPPDRPPAFMKGATRTNAAQSGQMANALRAEGERRDAPPDRPPKFMSEAKPATVSGQDGYLSTSLSEISRAPGEIWKAAREGAAEEKAGGAADVKEGVAAMRSGQPLQMLAGAAEDVRGTVRGLAAPLTGLAEGALYGLERTVDPQGLGLQPEGEIGAATAKPESARAGAEGRSAVEAALHEPTPPPDRPPSFMPDAKPVEAPKPIMRQKQVRPDEPPLAPDADRFYHGGANPTSGGGRWVSTDREYAHGYAEHNSRNRDEVHYVDIPRNDPYLKSYQKWDEHDEKAGINNVGNYAHFELPEERAKQLKRLIPEKPPTPKPPGDPRLTPPDRPPAFMPDAVAATQREPKVTEPEPATPLRPGNATFIYKGKVYQGNEHSDAMAAAAKAHGLDSFQELEETGIDEGSFGYVNKLGKHTADYTPEGPYNPLKPTPQPLGAAASTAPKLPGRPPRETMWGWEDNFNRLRKSTDADRSEFANYVKALPEEIRNPETMQKFFRRMEDPNHPLTPAEEAQFRQYVEPLKREELKQWEEAKKTDLDVADYDPTYAHRIVKGKAPELDRLTGYDPDNKFQIFGGGRSLPQSTSSMKERRFFAIQSETGERRVVARDDDGNLSVLSGGKFQPVPSNLKMKVGDAFKLDGQTWTMEQARVHEVTAAGGPEYYENAIVATIDNIMKLRRVNRAVYELNRLKGSPEWAAYARPIAERAPAGWRESLMPVFRGYRLEPRLANVIDDFYGHREPGGLVDTLGKINRWAVGTMFWSPVAHGLNATSHWATARAWDWINPVAYARMGKTMTRAIYEVAGQGEKYQALLHQGNGLLYSSVAHQKFYEKMLKDLGETIVRQPSRWGPIADALGVPIAALPKMLYEGSSRALWYWSDMLMMQRVLELEDKGMTLHDAVQEAERHIPSYRTRSELLGSRALAQATYNPAFTEFSRYHVDMLNSWGNIIKDVAKGGKDPLGHSRRVEALGALVTTGVVGMFIWPAIDAGYKKVFGPAAKFGVRGAQTLSYPLMDKAMQTRWAKEHLPRYILDYYNGDADVVTTIINLYGLAPTTRLIAELSPITNFHDLFTGQNTIEPADIRAGRVGRVAGQAAEHIAEGTVQPYQVFERARQGGKDVLKSFAEQATGGSEPNRAGRQKVFTHQEKQAQRRAAHPKGFLESIFDRSPF